MKKSVIFSVILFLIGIFSVGLVSSGIHPADTDPEDNCVSFNELVTYISVWLSGNAAFYDVIGAIQIWLGGCSASGSSINTWIEAENGDIVSPMISSGGSVYVTTDHYGTGGGSASFTFNVPASGNYYLETIVDAPNYSSNSFFPLKQAQINSQSLFRYIKVASLTVAPFQFNPL